MKARPDLLDARAPRSVESFQLTTETAVPSCHVYMEAQVFTPDSRRLVLHRSARPHGSEQHDPEHRYLLCDLDNNGALSPLTHEVGATSPAVSPDGKWLYYFVNETAPNAGRLTLMRVGLDGTQREVVHVLDRVLPGAKARISHVYPLSTLSSDGQRIAISGFFGDGVIDPPPFGLVVFDIPRATAELVLHGPTWCNIHPQYSRSLDAEASHDILVQENHGNIYKPDGAQVRGADYRTDGGLGVDVHVIRDDGTNLRDMPWGRDGREYCQGHQCWRGRSDIAIATTGNPDFQVTEPDKDGWAPHEERIIDGRAVATTGRHAGRLTPNTRRCELSRGIDKPRFFHFATDIAGKRFITDAAPVGASEGEIWLADFGEPLTEPLRNWTFLAGTRTPFQSPTHPHPFLSPDGRLAFWNSDESGTLQAYMARGF